MASSTRRTGLGGGGGLSWKKKSIFRPTWGHASDAGLARRAANPAYASLASRARPPRSPWRERGEHRADDHLGSLLPLAPHAARFALLPRVTHHSCNVTKGQAQAQALGKWLATQNFKFDRYALRPARLAPPIATVSCHILMRFSAFCSSAVRAKETAKLCLGSLSQKSSMPPPSCDVYDALEEIHMGGALRHSSSCYADVYVVHRRLGRQAT